MSRALLGLKKHSRRVFKLAARLNGQIVKFLLDTGSEISIISKSTLRRCGLTHLIYPGKYEIELDMQVKYDLVLRQRFRVFSYDIHALLGMTFFYSYDAKLDTTRSLLEISLNEENDCKDCRRHYITAEFLGGSHTTLLDTGLSQEMKIIPSLIDPETKQ